MYPSETSLLPVSVTFARFVQEHGFAAFNQWFDQWYAGVPFRLITEPLVPIVMVSTQRLMLNETLFSISIYFVILSLCISLVGWILVGKLFSEKPSDIKLLLLLVAYLITPWKYLDALSLSTLSVTVSRSVTPFLLLSYWYVLDSSEYRADLWARRILAIIVTSLLLFVSTASVPVIVISLVSVSMAHAHEENSFAHIWKRVKQLVGIVCGSFVLVTVWYTPEYWLIVLGNPSLGGLGTGEMLSRVFDLARSSLPLILAVVTVGFRKKFTSKLRVFIAIWTGTFFFITFFRFVSDYDFWMDWSAWFVELEVGLVLLLSTISVRKRFDIAGITIGIPSLISLFIYRSLGSPQLIRSSLPDAVMTSYDMVASAKVSRAFVSGSDTFWLNALDQTPQVRGGRDSFALHPYVIDASYQLREGKSAELADLWTDIFGVDTVVVHTSLSTNYYHDFRYTSKWNEKASNEVEIEGDILYRISNRSLAWSVDRGILNSEKPEKGDDKATLRRYLSFRNTPVPIQKISSSEYRLQASELGYIQLSITYHRKWKAIDAGGLVLDIVEDPFGFMVIKVPVKGEVKLLYSK